MDPAEIPFLSLFAFCAVSGVLVPIPEDVFILAAGWALHEGRLSPPEAFAAAFAGTFTRDTFAFLVGRFAGDRAWRLAARLLGADRLERARARFDGAATRTIFFTRFAVGMRAPLYFAGGTTHLPFARFVLLDLLGLGLTTPLLLWIGAARGPAASAWLVDALHHQRAVLVGVALLVGAAWFVRRRARTRPER